MSAAKPWSYGARATWYLTQRGKSPEIRRPLVEQVTSRQQRRIVRKRRRLFRHAVPESWHRNGKGRPTTRRADAISQKRSRRRAKELKRLRFEVLRRDNHACRYCGATAPEARLTVDHVTPVALGGSDEPTNLVTACADCNSGKSSVPASAPTVADVAADALRWATAMEQAHKIARKSAKERARRHVAFLDQMWEPWKYEHKGETRTFDLPPDWQDSLDRFYEAGISDEEIYGAVHTAMTRRNRDPFRYMCAIIWRWISERQEIATEIVRGETAADE